VDDDQIDERTCESTIVINDGPITCESPIVIDDELSTCDSTSDSQTPRSPKQVLRCRQGHFEEMRESLDGIRRASNVRERLDGMYDYIGSTADSDQSGDYGRKAKRSFRDFVAAELVDSKESEGLAFEFIGHIHQYQGTLKRIKAL
jgi:hypothetical protein